MSVPDFSAEACRLARAAGQAILAVYRRDFDVAIKDDHSPLTEADLASHRLLVDGLSAIAPGLPVVSEESAVQVPAVERLRWPRYWLVDPLDGTREFIKRNDEFIVLAPALDELAWAARGVGAWHEQGGIRSALAGRPLPEVPVVCVSRSHASARTQAVLDALGTHEALAAGSALKFIRLAQGRADLYPRLGPTSEWDTAAGQCIVEEAGGSLVDFAGVAFHYNRGESLLNPGFLAAADGRVDWARRLQPVLPREAQA
jgi:3'(2'), 5'-bisphosphate nucleotidase